MIWNKKRTNMHARSLVTQLTKQLVTRLKIKDYVSDLSSLDNYNPDKDITNQSKIIESNGNISKSNQAG